MRLSSLNQAIALDPNIMLASEGSNLVLGEGQSESPLLMWIGEAPGEMEERQGRPFVGKAGANLAGFLQTLGAKRADVYITNVVKFRPYRLGRTGRKRNRPPTGGEVALFLPWLEREIETVAPRYLITLGNTPLQALLGKAARIGDMHGIWQDWRGIPLFPMYHPAAIVYRRELEEVCKKDLANLHAHLA